MLRWLVVLLQIVIPGPIGFYLAYAMALGMPASPGRAEIPLIVVLGGAVIGFLAWLLGLIADRISLIRLVLTATLSILGLTVSYLLLELLLWRPLLGVWPTLYAASATPLAGAIAGYYWLWHSLQGEGQ